MVVCGGRLRNGEKELPEDGLEMVREGNLKAIKRLRLFCFMSPARSRVHNVTLNSSLYRPLDCFVASIVSTLSS